MHARWSSRARVHKRLATAVLLSALAHAWLSASLTSGGSGRGTVPVSAVPPLSLTARLVAPLPADSVRSVPAKEPSRPENVPVAAARERSETTAARPAERPQSEPAPIELAEATYYAARQLDVYPALVTPLDLRYPPEAQAREAQGRVLLMVHIDAQGAVDSVSVVEAEPAAYFEDDARRAFESARFRPALRNGRPVKSRILVQVDYGPAEAASR